MLGVIVMVSAVLVIGVGIWVGIAFLLRLLGVKLGL